MGLIRNLLALIGLVVVAGVIYLLVLAGGVPSFDARAGVTYWEMAKSVLATGNAAEATVWKIPVKDGLTAENVEEVMSFVANEHNIKNVGELPLYKEVEAISGQPYRFLKMYMYCNPMTAAIMVDHSDAYSAYLPCRISLVEDKTGKLWLYTLNMDLMIHGGTELPPELKAEAINVKDTMLDIMNRAANGEF
ncbi:MAG: DUF302 domain-containing protein [Thiotrichales bacterium]